MKDKRRPDEKLPGSTIEFGPDHPFRINVNKINPVSPYDIGKPLTDKQHKRMNDGLAYRNLGRDIGTLVAEKQATYGDSFGRSGQVMRELYPDGIPLDKLDDALTVVRVLDKLFRIATDRDAMGESPWRDIAGYALLATKRAEDDRTD